MKTPDEIKRGLKQCHTIGMWCNGCPYEKYEECYDHLASDALVYIDQLEERIDLMLIQMRGDCGTCKHRSEDYGPCNACVLDENRPAWEYEGLPEIGR